MRKLLLIISSGLLFITTSGFADLSAHGPYISGQVGYVNPHNDQASDYWADMILPFFTKTGSRASAGYRFNDYLAIEGGYAMLVDKSENSGANYKKVKISGYDVLGKAFVPLKWGFSFSIRGGIANIHQNIKNNSNNYDSDKKKYMPVGGFGFSYNFNRVIAISVSGTHYFKNSPIHRIDFVSLGATITLPFKW